MNKGFLYIATGDEYIEQAKESAEVTKSHSDLPIALVADRPVNSKFFDKVIIDQDPKYTYIDKCRNLAKTPFDRTVFLDTDVFLLDSIDEMFETLDKADIITTIDPNELGGRMREDPHFEDIPKAVPIYQTGVIAYNKCGDVDRFLSEWVNVHNENNETMLTDQSSFRIAIYESDLRHQVVSNLYNCLTAWPMQVTGEVKIIHGTPEFGKSDVEEVSSRINQSDSPRLFYTPRRGEIQSLDAPKVGLLLVLCHRAIKTTYRVPLLARNGLESVKEEGLFSTLRKIKHR